MDELDARDKELLRNIEEFNRVYAAGWHIQEKTIREDLSGVRLTHSSLASVQALHVNWKKAELTDTQFMAVEFQQAKFTEAELRRVVFTDCKFLVCSFDRAKLTGCRFIRCTSDELSAREAQFEDCGFESFEDLSGVFGQAALRTCAFQKSRLDNSAFHAAEFNAVAIDESSLHNVLFSDIWGAGLSFGNSAFHNCGFEESSYGELTIAGGRSKGITFKKFRGAGATIRECETIEGLTIRDCEWAAGAITGCKAISELTIAASTMNGLAMEDNQIAYLQIEGARFGGGSHLTACRVAGMNLRDSTFTGTRMTRCAIASYLVLDGATFDSVVLSGMAYARELRLSAQGTVYLNGSDEFPAG